MIFDKRFVKRWWLGLVMLFVLAQTAGLVHAQIHPFHATQFAEHHDHQHHHQHKNHFESEHGVTCDILDNLAQPFSFTTDHSFNVARADFSIPRNSELDVLIGKFYIAHFLSRAPPIA